jgi:hypothetical protein
MTCITSVPSVQFKRARHASLEYLIETEQYPSHSSGYGLTPRPSKNNGLHVVGQEKIGPVDGPKPAQAAHALGLAKMQKKYGPALAGLPFKAIFS